MIKNINTYKEWQRLSDKEKNYVVDNIWLNDMKKGAGIRKCIINEFKNKYINQRSAVIDVKFHWYGLYNFDIFVILKKGYKVRLPHKFDIFFVKKECEPKTWPT